MKRLSTIALVVLASGLWATEPPSTQAEKFILERLSLAQPECENPCPWDYNSDGIINNQDMLVFLGDFGIDTDLGCAESDFDEDGQVTIDDFRIFLPNKGTICTP